MAGAATYAALGFALLGPAATTPAFAYDDEQGCQSGDVEGGHDHAGGEHFKVTAHFHKNSSTEDCKDHPDSDQDTHFSEESGPEALAGHGAPLAAIGFRSVALTRCQATFSPASAISDSAGTASTTVTLPPNCPGLYVLSATTASGLKVTATVRETGGFPVTSGSAPAPTGGLPVGPALAMLLAGSGMVVGAGLIIYRRGSSNP